MYILLERQTNQNRIRKDSYQTVLIMSKWTQQLDKYHTQMLHIASVRINILLPIPAEGAHQSPVA